MATILSNRNWESDPVTGPQRALIKKLGLATDAEMRVMSKGQASVLISKALDEKGPVKSEAASQPQINLIQTLIKRLDLDPADYPLEGLTKKSASVILTELKSQGDNVDPDLTEGVYMIDNTVYKLKTGSHGRFTPFRLVRLTEEKHVSNGVRTHEWHRSSIRLSRFSAAQKMTREQAQQFAGATGTCVRCGTKLEETITQADGSPRWIGPVCETKMGW